MITSEHNQQALAEKFPDLGKIEKVAIDLEVTSVCDAVCGFCPREVMPDKKRFLSIELAERLADELRKHQVFIVILCGIGESTVHPELNRIVRILADTGTKIEMTTHGGARLDTRRFEELIDHGLTGFNFSLNAFTAATHRKVMKLRDFDRTVRNVHEIMALRQERYGHVAMHVSFVVCDLNAHEVMDFVEYWRHQPVSRVWLHPLNNRNTLLASAVKAVDLQPYAEAFDDDPQVLVDVFGGLHDDDRICKIARQMIFISSDGTMRLCAMDYRRVTSYGNLATDGLEVMNRRKLLTYASGALDQFCDGCDFCPTAIRKDQVNVGA